jgi:hypothetical protein
MAMARHLLYRSMDLRKETMHHAKQSGALAASSEPHGWHSMAVATRQGRKTPQSQL